MLLISTCLLLLSNSNLYAQNTSLLLNSKLVLESNSLTGLEQYTEEDLEDLDEAVLDSIFSNRQFLVTVAIHVTDTSNVENIHIRIGRSQGGVDVVDVTIPYNGATPPSVLAILKDNNEIEIEFGQYSNIKPLYMEVWLDDKDNGTTPVSYTSNL